MNLKFKIGLAVAIIFAVVLAICRWPAKKSTEAAPITAPATKLPVLSTEKPPAAPPLAKSSAVALPMVPSVSAAEVAPAAPTGDPRRRKLTPQWTISTAAQVVRNSGFLRKIYPPGRAGQLASQPSC